MKPTLASARIWAKNIILFILALYHLNPITTTCKTALKHREASRAHARRRRPHICIREVRRPLWRRYPRASTPRRTASLGTYRRVYQYHSDEMTPTDYAHRTRPARSRLGGCPPHRPIPRHIPSSDRISMGPTRLAKTSLSARLTSFGARSHSTRRTRDGNATRRFPRNEASSNRANAEGVHRQRRASGELISSARGRLHLRLRTDSRLGRVEFEGEVRRGLAPRARRELGEFVQHGEHQRDETRFALARRGRLRVRLFRARGADADADADEAPLGEGSFAPRGTRARGVQMQQHRQRARRAPPPSPSTAGPAAPSRRPVRWRRWRGFPRVEAARGVPRPR